VISSSVTVSLGHTGPSESQSRQPNKLPCKFRQFLPSAANIPTISTHSICRTFLLRNPRNKLATLPFPNLNFPSILPSPRPFSQPPPLRNQRLRQTFIIPLNSAQQSHYRAQHFPEFYGRVRSREKAFVKTYLGGMRLSCYDPRFVTLLGVSLDNTYMGDTLEWMSSSFWRVWTSLAEMSSSFHTSLSM